MEWHYRCPLCNKWIYIDWEKRDRFYNCTHCKKDHYPPSPARGHDSYVDTHDWPVQMENAVIKLRGTKCTVPGCGKDYETLDHREPYSDIGKTSVENLFPMCRAHNDLKGDENYFLWLLSIKHPD